MLRSRNRGGGRTTGPVMRGNTQHSQKQAFRTSREGIESYKRSLQKKPLGDRIRDKIDEFIGQDASENAKRIKDLENIEQQINNLDHQMDECARKRDAYYKELEDGKKKQGERFFVTSAGKQAQKNFLAAKKKYNLFAKKHRDLDTMVEQIDMATYANEYDQAFISATKIAKSFKVKDSLDWEDNISDATDVLEDAADREDVNLDDDLLDRVAGVGGIDMDEDEDLKELRNEFSQADISQSSSSTKQQYENQETPSQSKPIDIPTFSDRDYDSLESLPHPPRHKPNQRPMAKTTDPFDDIF